MVTLDQLIKARRFGRSLYLEYCQDDSDMTVGLFIRTSQMYANIEGERPAEVDALHGEILAMFGPHDATQQEMKLA